jgi:hypothetical protein
MIDLEFRSQATLPEKWQTGRFGDVGDSVLYPSRPGLASPHQVLRRFVRDAGSVNQALSPFGLMITVDRAARLPETTEIRSALPASKSIQSQIAAV